jgi:hypothetical protein
MSREKRPAKDAFGSSQLVKRSKADANLGASSAVAVSNGTGKNGALIQAVSHPRTVLETAIAESKVLIGDLGLGQQCAAVARHGAHRPYGGGFRSAVRSDRPAHRLRLHGSLNM